MAIGHDFIELARQGILQCGTRPQSARIANRGPIRGSSPHFGDYVRAGVGWRQALLAALNREVMMHRVIAAKPTEHDPQEQSRATVERVN